MLLTIFGIGLIYGLYSEGYNRLSTAHLLTEIALPALGGLAPVVWTGLIKVAVALAAPASAKVIKWRLDTQRVSAVTRAGCPQHLADRRSCWLCAHGQLLGSR